MLIFRYLQIASLAYLCSIFFKMVSCKSLSADLEGETPTTLQHHSPGDLRRTYKLYNKCSGNQVQIVGKDINARGSSDSTHANMSFISARSRHHLNAINIMGSKAGRYICFNKKGKLIVRANGRKKLCLFKEGLSKRHYTELQSVYDPSWHIGFNKKGKPLRGDMYSSPKVQECFSFLKRDHSYGVKQYVPPGPRIKHAWELFTGHKLQPQRKVPKTPTR